MELFGSLGATGKGHGSIPAVALGLMGERPDAVDPDRTPEVIATDHRHRTAAAAG